jgi:hypothetical protein
MAKLVDATDLESVGATHDGSNPSNPTKFLYIKNLPE